MAGARLFRTIPHPIPGTGPESRNIRGDDEAGPQILPPSYRILFFGHTARVRDPGYFLRHRKAKCWTNFSREFERLYLGFDSLPDSRSEERDGIVDEPVRRYKPVCNF